MKETWVSHGTVLDYPPQLFQLNQGSFTRLTQWAQQAGFHQAAEWLTTEQVESIAEFGQLVGRRGIFVAVLNG